MKIKIVVDANVIISALLGGKSRFILFDPRFEFITTVFTLKEVKRYIPEISQRSGVPEKEIKKAISVLPLRIVPQKYYKDLLNEAMELMQDIDPSDVDILALYLKEKTFLWSDDKDFEKIQNKINLLKTKDFFSIS